MKHETTAIRIKTYIANTFPGADASNFDEDDSLLEKGVIDSMSVLELVSFLEAEFEITIDDDDLVADIFQSVRTLAEFVERQVGKNSNAAA